MDDLISRQAAIEAINSHFGFNVEEEYGSAVQEVINGLPSAHPEPRWIPVEKRLPEDERYVLVTTVSGDVTEAKYWQKEGFWVLKRLDIMSVTAWQPLPQPYERSEDE